MLGFGKEGYTRSSTRSNDSERFLIRILMSLSSLGLLYFPDGEETPFSSSKLCNSGWSILSTFPTLVIAASVLLLPRF